MKELDQFHSFNQFCFIQTISEKDEFSFFYKL